MPDSADRDLDLVLFGATGFTGGADRRVPRPSTRPPDCAGRWPAAARRSSRRSAPELAGHRPGARRPRAGHADVADPASLADVAGRARVVITTVGPYQQYGEPLVAACAAAGTDYVDLTGEPEFVDRMYVAHHATAQAQRRPDRARLRLRLDPARPRRLLHRPAARGDRPGHDARRRPLQRHVLRRHLPLRDGRVLAGPADARGARGPAQGRAAPRGPVVARRSAGKPHRDKVLGYWLLPLPTIDPFIVARSGAALPAYGPKFRYSHYAGTKTLRYAAGGALRRRRDRRGRPGPAAAQVPARHGSSRATAPTRRAARSRGSPSTSSPRATAGRSTPGSPAATPATPRPPRCSPSRRCAWLFDDNPDDRRQVTTAAGDGRQPDGAAGRGRDHVRGCVTPSADLDVIVFDILGTMVDEPGGIRRGLRTLLPDIDGAEGERAPRGVVQACGRATAGDSGGPSPLRQQHGDRPRWRRPASPPLAGISDADAVHALAASGQRLEPWPDSVQALDRIASRFPVIGLSNASGSALTRISAHAGLRWQQVLSADEAQRATNPIPTSTASPSTTPAARRTACSWSPPMPGTCEVRRPLA